MYVFTPNTIMESAKVNANFDDVFYEEIARTTLGTAGDTITVNSIPAKKYLKILVTLIATGGSITGSVKLNNDSAANYAFRYSDNFGAGTTGVSSAPAGFADIGAGAYSMYSEITLTNIATLEKVAVSEVIGQNTAGAANAPTSRTIVWKWANTSAQVSRIDIINGGTGDFAIGSEVIILGHD